jgi:serine O-acetyltransferase
MDFIRVAIEDMNQMTLVKTHIGLKRFFSQIYTFLFSSEYGAVFRYRIYNKLSKSKYRLVRITGYILWEKAKRKYGIDIHPVTNIGKGFQILHLGNIVIGGKVIVGDYVKVNSGVTLGEKHPGGGMPIVGNNVYIGTGAKLLGNIYIGDGSIIGANAVVTESFSDKSIIVGIPAKDVKKVEKNI